ncbi:MAG: tRNA (adenosine(37)-N6)-threonylcarbamoyltransferase complex ATPase subunit type 1 TsaE [Planctomycetes bacterium]|nr:tRNA (adenosine(37)-N6)-threonylcarbamoyltransferase complex ATPase subunit type 1 TsaE [Planctomycetota bacterium]
MSELDDHRFLATLLGDAKHPGSLLGPGDDCALLPGGEPLLATTDALVEGRHYAAGTSATDIARKLVHRNFSDLAAMGAWPEFVLATFAFREGAWTQDARHDLYRAVDGCVRARGARWVGGDLSSVAGPSVFSLVALGRTIRRPVPRGGLAARHALFVSGPLGGSLVRGRHLRFEPRLEFARRLVTRYDVTAMIDLSDGLLLDLGRLLEASRLSSGTPIGVLLDAAAVPIHDDARLGGDPLEAALTDGEDYELLFALAPDDASRLQADADPVLATAVRIGVVDEGPGIRLATADGNVVTREPEGYVHEFEPLLGPPGTTRRFVTHSESETQELGRRLGAELEPGDGVVLEGELGAGKTVFVRGIAEGLGVDDPAEVRSPTYLLMIEHPGPKPLLHMDAYFAARSRDFLADGGEAYARDGFVMAIEWADRLETKVPSQFHRVSLRHTGPESRELTLIRGLQEHGSAREENPAREP